MLLACIYFVLTTHVGANCARSKTPLKNAVSFYLLRCASFTICVLRAQIAGMLRMGMKKVKVKGKCRKLCSLATLPFIVPILNALNSARSR